MSVPPPEVSRVALTVVAPMVSRRSESRSILPVLALPASSANFVGTDSKRRSHVEGGTCSVHRDLDDAVGQIQHRRSNTRSLVPKNEAQWKSVGNLGVVDALARLLEGNNGNAPTLQ